MNINNTIIHNLAQTQQVKVTLPIVAKHFNLVVELLFLADKLTTNGSAFIKKKNPTKTQQVVITSFWITNFLRTGIQENLQA